MKKIVLLFFCLLFVGMAKAREVNPLDIQPTTYLKLSEYKKIHKLLQRCDSLALDISYTDSEEGDSYGGTNFDNFKKWIAVGEDAARHPNADLKDLDWMVRSVFKSYEDEFYKRPFFEHEKKITSPISLTHCLKSIS